MIWDKFHFIITHLSIYIAEEWNMNINTIYTHTIIAGTKMYFTGWHGMYMFQYVLNHEFNV